MTRRKTPTDYHTLAAAPTNWRTAGGWEFAASYERIATGEKQ